MIYLGDRSVTLTTTNRSSFRVTSVTLSRHIGHGDQSVTLGDYVTHFPLVFELDVTGLMKRFNSPLHGPFVALEHLGQLVVRPERSLTLLCPCPCIRPNAGLQPAQVSELRP